MEVLGNDCGAAPVQPIPCCIPPGGASHLSLNENTLFDRSTNEQSTRVVTLRCNMTASGLTLNEVLPRD